MTYFDKLRHSKHDICESDMTTIADISNKHTMAGGYFFEQVYCFGVKNIVFGACEYFWAGWGGDCCGGEVGVSSPHPLSSILPQPVPQLTCASYVISARFKS